MDDDVQYLGTRLAVQEPLEDPCEHRLSVAGITLHVDKCGDKPAHDLSFYRAHSSHVNIGRKSGSDDKSMRRENDDHNAIFACQVVSARHAKLVFSDSGQVYIVDLHSRHGTHLFRRGESTPRTLQPEAETLLADGDVLTFGKVVGAGSYHVSPVTVRVELLTGRLSCEPPVRALTPCHVTTPRKLSSGRYGRYGLLSASCIESDSVHSSCSVSASDDAASSSPSDHESDVEEVDACRDQGKSPVKIPAFRSFISDMYHNGVLHSSCISELPLDDLSESPCSAVRHPSPIVAVIEPFSTKSRSHSPMVVATPSPSPPPVESMPEPEPAIIGAWPTSRPESPRRLSPQVDTTRQPEAPPAMPELDRQPEPLPSPPTPTCPRITTVPNDAMIELMMHRLPPPPPFFPIGGPFSSSISSDFGLPSIPHPPPPPLPPHPHPYRIPPFHPLSKIIKDCIGSEIKGSLKNVEDRITALQETVHDIRSRQSVTEDDMTDLQSQVEMLEPDSEHLLCRISGAERNIASLSLLQGQMTTLQQQVTVLRGKLDAPESKTVESPLQDVRACADALSSLVSEMKLLRDDVEKRIEAKMEAIQNARTEALDALKGVVAEAQSTKSLKRKRDDDDGSVDEETEEDVTLAEDVCMFEDPVVKDQGPSVLVPASSPLIPEAEASTPITVPAPAPIPSPCPVSKSGRPTKRMRTAMYAVAHTAAAVAIGAAATWSALAFS